MPLATSSSSRNLKRPPVEKGRWASKGKKPLPEQASVSHVLTIFVIHICRKIVMIEPDVKLMVYSVAIFFGSLLFDFLILPPNYLSYKDNIFNLFFVKLGWAWMILIVGSFIFMTSITYGCGNAQIVKRHVTRLVIGTGMWLFWTQWFFYFVEYKTGMCLGKRIIKDQWTCDNMGFQWHAFDISGHAFLLVYMNLVIVEEARAMTGWEGIKDLIRSEEHSRSNLVGAEEPTSLKILTEREFQILKDNYEFFTPYIRVSFIAMTVLSLFSDVMLMCTVIYFHTMPQKVVGGGIAITAYFLTYRWWYKTGSFPGMPGVGLFKYQHLKEKGDAPTKRNSSIYKESSKEDRPTFMGMPLHHIHRKDDDKSNTDNDETHQPKKSKYGQDRRKKLFDL